MTAREDKGALQLLRVYIQAQGRIDQDADPGPAQAACNVRPTVVRARPGRPHEHVGRESRRAAADWAGALDALDSMKGALAKPDYRRKRAVLLAARAQELEGADRDSSRALVLEAVKRAPDLVPAAALAGRRLAEARRTAQAPKSPA